MFGKAAKKRKKTITFAGIVAVLFICYFRHCHQHEYNTSSPCHTAGAYNSITLCLHFIYIFFLHQILLFANQKFSKFIKFNNFYEKILSLHHMITFQFKTKATRTLLYISVRHWTQKVNHILWIYWYATTFAIFLILCISPYKFILVQWWQ